MCVLRANPVASEGRIHMPVSVLTMLRTWIPWGSNLTPTPQQRAADSLVRKPWKIPWIFGRSRVVLPAVPALRFFTQFFRIIIHNVFHVWFRPFLHNLFFFSLIFSHYLSLLFSHIFSHVRFCTFFLSYSSRVCCQKVFIVCSLCTA